MSKSILEKLTYTSQSHLRCTERTVLLIGSTGNGKSTLGNFLLMVDPDNDEEVFATATDNMPKTQNTRVSSKTATDVGNYSNFKITVIDTPGLNEDPKKDLEHMVRIIRTLQEVKEIGACVFVVKFNTKIDDQYRKTVEYYSKLLPFLFERNVFIVMTDYATDSRSIKQRKRKGINEEQIVQNTKTEIVSCAGLTYDDPMVFKLDCLPIDEEEKEFSSTERTAILQYIAGLDPVCVSSDLKVAKTEYILRTDKEKIKELEGEVTGYKNRLNECNIRSKHVLDKLQAKEKEVAEENEKVESLTVELQEKDTAELVTTSSWSVDSSWKFFQTQTQGYSLKSAWDISNIRRWDNGNCRFAEEKQTSDSLSGKVVGSFMRGLYASITLETKKCYKYQERIKSLNAALQSARTRVTVKTKELELHRNEHKEHIADISSFENYIQEKRKDIHELTSKKMSLTEAENRLKQITDQTPTN